MRRQGDTMRKTLATLFLVMVAGTALATVPGTDLFVPAVGHALGAVSGGVQAWWRGDVWIFNPSTTQLATVDIFLLLRDRGNPTPTAQRITVNPRETRYLPDIVFNTFGLDNTYGGLRIVSTVPVVVSGRSYDANVTVVGKGQGTAGQFFSGVPADLAIGLGDSTDVIGLDQDGFQTTGLWRSNLAFVETTGNPVDLTIQRLDSNGTVLNGTPYTYHLEGRQVSQINYVITSIVNTTGTNQRIHVAVTGGTGRVIANASRLDNRTGDPSTIESVMIHTFGLFEGTVLDAATGTVVDGGIQLEISASVLTSFSGVAGIPCGSDSYTLNFSPNSGSTATINPDGTFATFVSIPYTDGTNTLFTTKWTLTGARDADGRWSGTLESDTSGGSGTYAPCNAVNVVRPWRATWSANS
jgi:hypothetical protein